MATTDPLQHRVDELENQVRALLSRLSGDERYEDREPKTVDEVSPVRLMEIKAFARDVPVYGMRKAMRLHGFAVPEAGRKKRAG